MGNHRCVCRHEFCKAEGGEATIRMPKDEALFKTWCNALFGQDTLPTPLRDPRVSTIHFPADSFTADGNIVGGAALIMKLKEGALPTKSSAEMKRDSKGALARSLRDRALVGRYEKALWVEVERKRELESEIRKQRLRIVALEAEIRDRHEGKVGNDSELGERSKTNGIDHNILVGKSPTACRSISGLRSHESLTELFAFVNAGGAAEQMIFWNERHGGGLTPEGERVESRGKIFRGINGLFFTLFVMRTGLPLVTASTLFGVHETTGGRAFTSWLTFLDRSFRPFVRLPTLEKVHAFAPRNFVDRGYGDTAIVLDATEIEIPRSWQSDMKWVTYSAYKGRPTAKLLVGITSGGAICYVGPAYPGRMSDADCVKESGLLALMRQAGLCGHGLKVMCDKGFNAISPNLVKEGLLYVAPPYKRPREDQFTGLDMEIQWEIANLRIHVERAIGAIKNWNILNKKFDHRKLDQLEMCFRVAAALVNMIQRPFRSDK